MVYYHNTPQIVVTHSRSYFEKLIIQGPHPTPRFPLRLTFYLFVILMYLQYVFVPYHQRRNSNLKYYDARCGYYSDNECGDFINSVSGEQDFGDEKYLPYSMVGEFIEVNQTTDEAGKLVLLSNIQINVLIVGRLSNELDKLRVNSKRFNICQ